MADGPHTGPRRTLREQIRDGEKRWAEQQKAEAEASGAAANTCKRQHAHTHDVVLHGRKCTQCGSSCDDFTHVELVPVKRAGPIVVDPVEELAQRLQPTLRC